MYFLCGNANKIYLDALDDVMPASSFCEPNVPVAGIPCRIYLPRVIPVSTPGV